MHPADLKTFQRIRKELRAMAINYVVLNRCEARNTAGIKRRLVSIIMVLDDDWERPNWNRREKAVALAKFLTAEKFFETPCTVEAYPGRIDDPEELLRRVSTADGTRQPHLVAPLMP